jgi:hypothetical protein
MRANRARTMLLVAVTALPLLGLEATMAARAAGAASAPGAPRSVSAGQNGSGGARVSWRAPASDGGSAITNYVVTPFEAGVAQPARSFAASQTFRVLSGLQNGKSYRFRVTAQSTVGLGAPSAQSGGITIGAPGRPIIMWVKKDARPGAVRVRVNRGIVNQTNGAPVLRLNATCTSSNGGVTGTGRMLAPPAPDQRNMNPWVIVGRLTLGKMYRCTVVATNSRGTGIGSTPSATIAL